MHFNRKKSYISLISVLIYSINYICFFLYTSPRAFYSTSSSSTTSLSSSLSITTASFNTTYSTPTSPSLSPSPSTFLRKYIFESGGVSLSQLILSKRVRGRLYSLLGSLLTRNKVLGPSRSPLSSN